MSPNRETPRRIVLDEFSYAEHVQYCFHRPCPKDDLPKPLRDYGYRPVLHLLRRDLQPIYGEEGQEAGELKPPFVVLSAIMTGFDILSALSSDSDPEHSDFLRARELLKPHSLEYTVTAQLGLKFRRFLKDYASLSPEDAEFMWRIRGSVVHTYSLTLARTIYPYVTVENGAVPASASMIQRRPSIVGEKQVTEHVLYLRRMKGTFLEAVERFRRAVETAELKPLGQNFLKQMKRSGYIQVPIK